MTRPRSIEDAILQAYLASRQGRHEDLMLCLAFALTQAGRAREAGQRAPFVGSLTLPDDQTQR